MIVFKGYFRIVKAYLPMVILYTGIFLLFSIISTLSYKNDVSNFSTVKPNVAIINNDYNSELIKSFNEYLSKNAKIVKIKNDETSLKDALFFRKVDYILIIPKGFTNDFMNDSEVKIETMKVPDSYRGTYSEMLLNRFLNIAKIYVKSGMNEKELSKNVLLDLEKSASVNLDKTKSASALDGINYYYNFSNYTLLALTIMIIGMTMASFRERNIQWRNMSSPISLRRINFELALGNLSFTIMIWLLYVLISLILYYKVMFSFNGLLLIVNSFVFVICALSLGFLIGNLVKNQQANSSLTNVISLGSSFLCGAFVPQSVLGEQVLKFSRIFPSYWFIKNNDYIVSISKYSTSNLITIFTNMLIVLVFALLFYIITQVITKKLFKNS